MRNDELIDELLRETMATEPRRLSPTFDASVMQGVRPRRLTPSGRAAVAAYALVALVGTVWLMQDLPIDLIALSLAITSPVAAGAAAYGRRLVAG